MLIKFQTPILNFIAFQSLQQSTKAQTWTNLFDWHGQDVDPYDDSFITGADSHITTFNMFMNTNS
jgi:hypothetical protein